ncbi:MAG: CRISPR-associated protein Cas4 [Bacteroidales bacterium]|nr:CRISPR-associated protein Cas4 [Bacteroidales bacterium]
MQITGTHFNYYMICHRKLWLFSQQIQMEHTSDLVYEGKLIHETTYTQRTSRYQEVALEGIKVDFYDAKNRVIHEVKKSDKRKDAHIWQLKYYMWVFEENGFGETKGILEYPKLRMKEEVILSLVDKEQIKEFRIQIDEVISKKKCPAKLSKSRCKNCSYYDFCHSNED